MTAEEKFMTIAALEAYRTKSFEEVRIDDYLKAYTTTGKPPPPCPEQPTGDMERQALGLPPLFKPYPPVPGPTASTSSLFTASTATKPTTTNPADLPTGQEFTAIKVDGETYQSISCTAQYAFFSPEELRYYAYLRGNITAPPGVKMAPFVKSVVSPSSTTPAAPATLDSGETLQSIIAQPAYADHSFEELRVYYLLAGRREVTSAEIRQYLGESAPVPPPVIAVTPAAPTVTPQPVLGGSISTPLTIQPKATPSFSFKF
ncbi:hypothetical protein NMY22_g8188 [Coprinellus aureogranulatus]|nr:hypothetical protein NMY22_g8188 [Coprinellus aureogranulatus]